MLTQRQEKFARFLFQGKTQREAWGAAGYSTRYPVEWVDSHACIVANSAKIKARLQQLRDKAAEVDIMSVAERKRRLSEIAQARLVDFQDDSGEPILDKTTPNNGAARKYYHRTKYDKNGNPTVTKAIELGDPVGAIQELNKMDGVYTQKEGDNHLHLHINVSSERGKELVERLIEGKMIEGVQDAGHDTGQE